MCYKSGGGVFLVPYFIILIVCSIPMLFMELSVGQYTGRGPIGALSQLCPLFKGAAVASVIVSFIMSTYYSVLIAYSIYYFFTSFKPLMPWTDCNNRLVQLLYTTLLELSELLISFIAGGTLLIVGCHNDQIVMKHHRIGLRHRLRNSLSKYYKQRHTCIWYILSLILGSRNNDRYTVSFSKSMNFCILIRKQ